MYSSFDFLCNEPFYLDGIGNVKCPTLRDIRKITYKVFSVYLTMITTSLENYLKLHGLEKEYNELNDSQKEKNTFYNLLLLGNTRFLFDLLRFFIVDEIEFNTKTGEFDIYKMIDAEKHIIGHLNSNNFEQFRLELQYVLGINKVEKTEQKYKNKMAKDMFEKLKKHEEEEKSKKNNQNNSDFELDNMILKYCTHNKVGISILNVWDMTYYQFTHIFSEYCNARQCDFNDMMAANTFSYKNSSDYKPMEYMKKIK